MKTKPQTWQFTDDEGTFRLENPHHTSFLYFPLVNQAGMMSALNSSVRMYAPLREFKKWGVNSLCGA